MKFVAIKDTITHNLPKERWKDIPGFEGLYQLSDLGRVRSLSR
jgi:NUMOD4 motif